MESLTLTPRSPSAIRSLNPRPCGTLPTIAPVLVFELIEKLFTAFSEQAQEREQTKRYLAAAALEAEKYRQDAIALRMFMAKVFQERRQILDLAAAGLRSDKIEIYEAACQLVVEILRVNPLLQYSEMLRHQRNEKASLRLEDRS